MCIHFLFVIPFLRCVINAEGRDHCPLDRKLLWACPDREGIASQGRGRGYFACEIIVMIS
jgi:hypothetical protein